MEKENKEIVENTEQKEYRVKESGQTDKKKVINKKKTYAILGIILLLCLGIFIFLRINMTEKHVYEEVENLGEREGVCFDNLLISSMIYIYNNGEGELKYLCIFNNGDVYCFEWLEQSAWNIYYHGYEKEDYYRNCEEEDNQEGYDDTNWSKMENVVYLGRLSNWDIVRLNHYVQNYDIGGEYYMRDIGVMEVPDGHGGNYQGQERLEEQKIWRGYSVTLFWHEQRLHNRRKHDFIINCDMNYLGNGLYEKGELIMKSYEENAMAALDLFESSGFYDRWVAMCLSNE